MLLVGSLLQIVPKHKAAVLASIPKIKKVAMCLAEKMPVSDTLVQARVSAVGSKFV